MAFRIETRLGVIVVSAALVAGAQEVRVRHHHWHGGGMGDLRVGNDGISFAEGQKKSHSRTWKYEEIQQFELTADTLSVLTYEDQKWNSGAIASTFLINCPRALRRQSMGNGGTGWINGSSPAYPTRMSHQPGRFRQSC